MKKNKKMKFIWIGAILIVLVMSLIFIFFRINHYKNTKTGNTIGDKTLHDAFLKLTLAESYAQVVLNTKILGGAKILNKEQAEEILELRKKL